MKEVLQSLEGSHIESDQRLKMNIASQHMDQIDSHVRRLETEMAIRCIPYATLINLLVDIPGISYLSARTIIAEIGTDMSVFETSKQLSTRRNLSVFRKQDFISSHCSFSVLWLPSIQNPILITESNTIESRNAVVTKKRLSLLPG